MFISTPAFKNQFVVHFHNTKLNKCYQHLAHSIVKIKDSESRVLRFELELDAQGDVAYDLWSLVRNAQDSLIFIEAKAPNGENGFVLSYDEIEVVYDPLASLEWDYASHEIQRLVLKVKYTNKAMIQNPSAAKILEAIKNRS